MKESELNALERLQLSHDSHHDLALVRFKGGLPQGFAPAQLLSDTSVLVRGAEVFVAGYGVSDPTKPETSGTLRKASTQLWIADLNENELLIDNSNGKGVCFGDSGGPAYIKKDETYFLFAVNSRLLTPSGFKACHSASVMTSLAKSREWLRTALRLLPPVPVETPKAYAKPATDSGPKPL